MSDVVLFGSGEQAEVAYYYLTHDSPHTVRAFTVDRDYIAASTLMGLPVLPFDEIEVHHPPESTRMLVAIGYTGLNSLRRKKYDECKQKGYELISYVSSRTSLWANPVIGDNCFVLEDVTIQPYVRIGNNVTIWSGNHLGHHCVIKDDVFITSHVVISGGAEIGESCFLGVNATIRDHIKIGPRCIIGAGALILRDCEEEGLYPGVSTTRAAVPSSKIKKI
jgi:sugar O-acyltransferase (sialic acid O-acetyltransferase NeuD family)